MLAGRHQAVRLVAQIHDELLFEANTELCDVYVVVGELPPPPPLPAVSVQAFHGLTLSVCI